MIRPVAVLKEDPPYPSSRTRIERLDPRIGQQLQWRSIFSRQMLLVRRLQEKNVADDTHDRVPFLPAGPCFHCSTRQTDPALWDQSFEESPLVEGIMPNYQEFLSHQKLPRIWIARHRTTRQWRLMRLREGLAYFACPYEWKYRPGSDSVCRRVMRPRRGLEILQSHWLSKKRRTDSIVRRKSPSQRCPFLTEVVHED